MNKKVLVFAAFLLSNTSFLRAVTLVYNMKVRRIFVVSQVLERAKNRLLATVVPIYFSRSRKLFNERTGLDGCEKRRAGGALFNFRYVPNKHWWFELTTGIETDHGTFTGTDPFHASRTGFDDIVLSGGYRHFWGKRCQLVAYGLAGFPARRKIELEDRHTPLVGTRLFNLGFGTEASYSFISEMKRSLAAIAQLRFIHGFNRSFFPIFPRDTTVQPGNATDLLFTMQYRKKRTIFEAGYNVTFFTNAALITPTETIKEASITRHSGFFSVSHGVFKGLFDKPNVFGAGINGSRASSIDATTITAWVFFTVVF